jgi:hypothetical protein
MSHLSIIEIRLFTPKKTVMKQQHIHQELLVFTTTSLSRKVLCETNNHDKNENMSPAEKLEQACWNGLINYMFPEIIGSGLARSPKIFIWGIYPGKSCLLIDLADTSFVIDAVRSIDPHLFLSELNSN